MDDSDYQYTSKEVYSDVKEGRIPVENNIKHDLLNALLKYGSIKKGKGHIWSTICPLLVVSQILTDMQVVLDDKVTVNGYDATEDQLEYLRTMYGRFYRIKREVRTILHEEFGQN